MALLPFGLVFILFVVLGARLLRSARETGGAELWLAVFFLAAAAAIPFRLAMLEPGLGVDAWAPSANLVGHLATSVAICGFIVFVWRVFRGADRWARGLAAGLIGAQLASLGALIVLGGYRDERSTALLVCNAVRALPFAWGFLESLRYHRLMKRRLRMNLADSVVANRFGLFSIWTGALFLLPLSILVVRLAIAQYTWATPRFRPLNA